MPLEVMEDDCIWPVWNAFSQFYDKSVLKFVRFHSDALIKMTSMSPTARNESASTDLNSSGFIYSSMVLTEASFDEDEFKARMAMKLVKYGEP